MAYTEEKKQEVLHLLATEAGNNTTRCAQLTGISKTTILCWKKAQETQSPDGKSLLIPSIPSTPAPLPAMPPVIGNPTLSLHGDPPVASGNIPEIPPSPHPPKPRKHPELPKRPKTLIPLKPTQSLPPPNSNAASSAASASSSTPAPTQKNSWTPTKPSPNPNATPPLPPKNPSSTSSPANF